MENLAQICIFVRIVYDAIKKKVKLEAKIMKKNVWNYNSILVSVLTWNTFWFVVL